MLSAGEARAAEALLARAWGEPAVVRAAELIWGRRHIVRLRLETGRTVVLKRRRDQARGRAGQVFGVELAALDYLNAMPVPVACFASLPADIASPAIDAYRARLEAGGIGLGPEWEDLTTAVLAGLIIARGHVLAQLWPKTASGEQPRCGPGCDGTCRGPGYWSPPRARRAALMSSRPWPASTAACH